MVEKTEHVEQSKKSVLNTQIESSRKGDEGSLLFNQIKVSESTFNDYEVGKPSLLRFFEFWFQTTNIRSLSKHNQPLRKPEGGSAWWNHDQNDLLGSAIAASENYWFSHWDHQTIVVVREKEIIKAKIKRCYDHADFIFCVDGFWNMRRHSKSLMAHLKLQAKTKSHRKLLNCFIFVIKKKPKKNQFRI